MSEIEINITNLLDLLQSPDSVERERAVNELAASNADEAIAGLVIALEDEDGSVREAAAEHLSQVRGETTTMLLSEFLGAENIRTRNLAAEILVKIGDDAVGGLLGWLSHEDHDVRKFVVDVLGLIGNDSAVEELCQSLWDENINVCCSAAESLGLIGSPQATEALIAAAEKIADVRPQAIEALGKIRDPRGIDLLIDYLTHGDPLLMFAAAEALGNIGSPKALKELSTVINDRSVEVAEEAFKSALRISESIRVDLKEHISGERLRKFIVDGFVSNEQDVISFALRSPDIWTDAGLVVELLENITRIHEDTTSRFVSQVQRYNVKLDRVLLPMLKDADTESLKALLNILGHCVSPGEMTELTPLISHVEPEVRKCIATVIGNNGSFENIATLRKLATDSVGHVRSEAFKGMGWIGSEETIDDLITGLDDDYPDVREVCVGALVTIGGSEVIAKFTAELTHDNSERQRLAAAALGWIGEDQSVEPLTEALGHSAPAVRREALAALSRMGNTPDYDTLVLLMNDEDDIVQKVAMSALAATYPDRSTAMIATFIIDDDVWLRFHAISVLKTIKHPDALEALKAAASDGPHETRVAAINALGESDAPEVRAYLLSLSDGGERDVAEALAHVGDRSQI